MTSYIVEGGRPLNGTITPSGNKNEALPVLMACLLTKKEIILRRIPKIKDVLSVCEILIDLGVKVEWQGEVLSLQAEKIIHTNPKKDLCGRVRAAILLLGPLLARCGKIELAPPGGDIIGARRMDTHFDGAKALGAHIDYDNCIKASVKNLIGAEIYLDEPSVTGTENLIMLSVLAQGETTIYNAASEPHVAGLCHLLNQMGAKIQGIGTNRLVITGVSVLNGADFTIGPDFMEVGSYLCLGAIGGGVVTIEDIRIDDLRFALKTWSKIGINPIIGKNSLTIDGQNPLKMQTDISGRVSTIYSGPWPAFPTDLMSVTIVAATQAYGTMIFFEKMFEGRMFFTDKLMSMGANIVLCDPHRIVVNGPSPLVASHLSSPDVRAGMAMVMAACVAKGKSTIDNIYQVERGYKDVVEKIQALGGAITSVYSAR